MSGLVREIAVELSQTPGQRARELASCLRARGFPVDRREVNQIVYGNPVLFKNDADWRWSLTKPLRPLAPVPQPVPLQHVASPSPQPTASGAISAPSTSLPESASEDSEESLLALIGEALAVCPGQTAKEIASAVRREGFDVRRGTVNSILYKNLHLFEKSTAVVPAWTLRAASPPGFRGEVDAPAASVPRPSPPPMEAATAALSPPSRPTSGVRRSVGEWRFDPASLGVLLPITLYRWQRAALEKWKAAGYRGVVEAVTGTGKTRVGIKAIQEALELGGCAHVLVPTIDLQEQWCRELRTHFPNVCLGRRGDGWSDRFVDRDVIVSVVNSARD